MAVSRNLGSGSYSYRSSYADENDEEPIPVYGGSREVQLNVYPVDSASAVGCSLISGITGVPIKHSTIVVYGVEHEFSQKGVERKAPSRDRKPALEEKIHLGYTNVSARELIEEVESLIRTQYRSGLYNARTNNCHNFSNDLSLFLTGDPIPARFLDMADEVASAATKTALIAGGVVGAGLLTYNLMRERPQGERERQAPQNNNGLLMGLGAVAAGGLAYHLLSSDEEPQRVPQRTSPDESASGGGGLLGALAAGAAGLAAALDSSNQQPRQRALGFGAGNNNANEDGPAEWLDRMLNLR